MSIGYEKSDVSIKSIFSIGAISIIIIIAIIISVSEYFSVVKEEMIQEVTMRPVSEKLLTLHEYEAKQLSSYGVIDKKKASTGYPLMRL